MTLVQLLFKLFIVLLPWPVKRHFLQTYFNYKLHPKSRIGLSWIYPSKLTMGSGSKIGNLCVAVNLSFVEIGDFSTIDRCNWITGFPSGSPQDHFSHQPDRIAQLIVGSNSAITKFHHFDCTNEILIGSFTTIAGYNSQFLTHSIDIVLNRQHSNSIIIGSYCFVGTSCVVLPGSVLPDYCVLGAASLLNKPFILPTSLYGGSPATFVKALDPSSLYFSRTVGFVK